MKELPNKLTAARFGMVALFPVCFFGIAPLAGLAMYVLAFLTDVLDGYLARKYDAVTPWGQTMDPLADKLMLSMTLLCLAIDGRVPWWFFIVVTAKDVVMVVIGLFMYSKMDRFIQPANIVGKLATFSYMLAIVLSFFNLPKLSGYDIALTLLYIAFALSLVAFATYAWGFGKRFFARSK